MSYLGYIFNLERLKEFAFFLEELSEVGCAILYLLLWDWVCSECECSHNSKSRAGEWRQQQVWWTELSCQWFDIQVAATRLEGKHCEPQEFSFPLKRTEIKMKERKKQMISYGNLEN